ncbi:MAG: type II toxin-antitoxin system PemK/MazF family toxin [Gammaproteobacteria bacterium]|nr:type II toxin-antitoxin system PemK/MazF family toxin [Gammaproteobacteria bacterium]
MDISKADVVLCEFYFSDLKVSKKRPVLILKDNLPFDDFIAIPISSQIRNFHPDEVHIGNDCFQYGGIPKKSKLMLRKTFVVSKSVVLKKYGTLSDYTFNNYHKLFCQFFECSI